MSFFSVTPASRPKSFWGQVGARLPWKRVGTYFICGRSKVVHKQPPNEHNFALGISGVAAILGSEEAISTMATVHVYESRRWLGWYNSPGSYHIARRYAHFAGSKLFNSLSLGIHTHPAALFERDGGRAPKFRAAHSSAAIEETGPLAALLMKGCAALEGKAVRGETTQVFGVSIAELHHVPPPQTFPERINPYTPVLASIPISISIATCVACAVFRDWFSFMSILSGILANGISCYAIGSGKIMFTHPDPGEVSPLGDGILISDNEVVLLKGEEGAVNCITRGRFLFDFTSKTQFKSIGWCSVLFSLQFLTQLFLAPYSSSFGQLMFVVSLATSWIYNIYISSLDEEKIQRDILLDHVLDKPVLSKYILGTRTAMVVFILLVLQPEEPAKLLNELLPNDTKVWRRWKEAIVQRLDEKQKLEFIDEDRVLTGFNVDEGRLVHRLFDDAEAAYCSYLQYTASK